MENNLSGEQLFDIADEYYDGKNGKEKNLQKAVEYMQMSAAQGFIDADYALGSFYLNGEGVVLDNNKAREYFIKSLVGGIDEAKEQLALLPPVQDEPLPPLPFADFESYQQKLRQLNAQMGQGIPAGATAFEVNLLTQVCEADFGVLPPQEYLDFLRYQNGFEFNEQIIYGYSLTQKPEDGCYDFVAFNLDETAEYQDFLILGRGSADDFFAYDIDNEKYVVLNFLDVMEEFERFDEFLKYVFNNAF